MKTLTADGITNSALARMSASTNPRLKQIVRTLTKHLHAFAREVELTPDEWLAGIQFLTDVGHITDEKRQEFILLSDTLGLSMLVMSQNNRKPSNCTEATVFGPFYVE